MYALKHSAFAIVLVAIASIACHDDFPVITASPDRELPDNPDRSHGCPRACDPDRLPDGTDLDVLDETLVGTWVRDIIGDCFSLRLWLELRSDGRLTLTREDINACTGQTPEVIVSKADGSWSANGDVFRFDVRSGNDRQEQVFTYAVDDVRLEANAYVPLAADADGNTVAWRRLDYSDTVDPEDDFRATTSTTIDVGFPNGVSGPDCTMEIVLEVEVSPEPRQSAEEAFALPCRAPITPQGRLISAIGFENSGYDGSWGRYLHDAGIDDKYDEPIRRIIHDAFRPVLLHRTDLERLVHPTSIRGWDRTQGSPP